MESLQRNETINDNQDCTETCDTQVPHIENNARYHAHNDSNQMDKLDDLIVSVTDELKDLQDNINVDSFAVDFNNEDPIDMQIFPYNENTSMTNSDLSGNCTSENLSYTWSSTDLLLMNGSANGECQEKDFVSALLDPSQHVNLSPNDGQHGQQHKHVKNNPELFSNPLLSAEVNTVQNHCHQQGGITVYNADSVTDSDSVTDYSLQLCLDDIMDTISDTGSLPSNSGDVCLNSHMQRTIKQHAGLFPTQPDNGKTILDAQDNNVLKLQNQMTSGKHVVTPVDILDPLENNIKSVKANKPSNKTQEKKGDGKVKKNAQIKIHPSYADIKCQVCGAKAVGFHYGADVCTGCRLFFIRNHKTDPKHSCKNLPENNVKVKKAPCPACRLEICFKAGMNTKASKRGRYSYERMSSYATSNIKDKAIIQKIPPQPQPVTDEIITLATRISDAFLSCSMYPPNYFENISRMREIYLKCRQTGTVDNQDTTTNPKRIGPHGFREVQMMRYKQTRTCVQSYQSFVKKLPGYNRLPEKDQSRLYTKNLPALLFISEYRACDIQNGLEFYRNGEVATKEEMMEHFSPGYGRTVFDISEKLQKLNLDENERNLLKLVGFFEAGLRISETGSQVAAREQDVMIRAFDYVVRANRPGGNQAAVVIGNAMQVLSALDDFRRESMKEYQKNSKRYPLILSNWIQRTFMNRKFMNGK